jgi:hypothetical protein
MALQYVGHLVNYLLEGDLPFQAGSEYERQICYYGSMASEDVIDSTVKMTRVCKIVQIR